MLRIYHVGHIPKEQQSKRWPQQLQAFFCSAAAVVAPEDLTSVDSRDAGKGTVLPGRHRQNIGGWGEPKHWERWRAAHDAAPQFYQ